MSLQLISVLLSPQAILRVFEPVGRPPYVQLCANMKEAINLAAFRDALFPKLIYGEIRVRESERLVEAVA